jgi:hypothetical protein
MVSEWMRDKGSAPVLSVQTGRSRNGEAQRRERTETGALLYSDGLQFVKEMSGFVAGELLYAL